MIERYIAFDVETPNAASDRMSAIGIAVVENGALVQTWHTLVNPECRFDAFNIALTKITPEMVQDAPTFPELWTQIEPVVASGILAAHNAPFDLRVLRNCLHAYKIPWKPWVSYVCTCRMGRFCYPNLPNHKLNTLCMHLGIALDHHQAGSDSNACAQLLLNYLHCGIHIGQFIRRYSFND